MRFSISITAAWLALFSIQVLSNTITVPVDYPTIQGAIDASINGDTILVEPGSYVENIDFKGKAITVESTEGPTYTLIDGGCPKNQDKGSVVTFDSGEVADSILCGFTLTNGKGTLYGTYYLGGGVYCMNTSPILNNNIIEGNDTTGSNSGCGGGIFIKMSSATVTGNTIRLNKSNSGAGLNIQDSSAVISNNKIYNNDAIYGGGGIEAGDGDTSLFINNIIAMNTANHGGGGIYFVENSPTVINTTLYFNSSANGNEIKCYSNVNLTIANSIIWNSFSGCSIYLYDKNGPSSLTISHSDVSGGKSAVSKTSSCTLNWGPGMIDANPMFIDPADYDFHIQYISPCSNAGDKSISQLPAYDFEGDPRIVDGIPDMGADEFYRHLYLTGDFVPSGAVGLQAHRRAMVQAYRFLVQRGHPGHPASFKARRLVPQAPHLRAS